MHTLHIRHENVNEDGTIEGRTTTDARERISQLNGWLIVTGNGLDGDWSISCAGPRDKDGNMDVVIAHFDSKKELEAWLRTAIKEVTGREVLFVRK